MSRKLPYWDAKNGFAACYNMHLSICRDPVEAKKRARAEWDPLPQEEKDVINKRVKSEWAKNHPPAVPKEVDPEEKKWKELEAREHKRLKRGQYLDRRAERELQPDIDQWREMGGHLKKARTEESDGTEKTGGDKVESLAKGGEDVEDDEEKAAEGGGHAEK